MQLKSFWFSNEKNEDDNGDNGSEEKEEEMAFTLLCQSQTSPSQR